MGIKTVSIVAKNSSKAIESFKQNLGSFDPKVILFFASSIYDASSPEKKLELAFPNAQIIGSTSHSEYCRDEFLEDSISFMAIDKDTVSDICINVVENISEHPDFSNTLNTVHNYMGGYEHILENFDKYVGIVIFEGSAKAEEYCMDKIGGATDIIYIGGSSSEKEGSSKVYANGESYKNAVVMATLRTVSGYGFMKTQSANLYSNKGYNVTKSDVKNRIMYEIENRPVTEIYAQILGIDKQDVSKYFVSNPLGVIADDEIFIRTFNQIEDDGISLHCGIPEGTEIHILKTGDIISDTKSDLERYIKKQPAGVINFNCLYRTFEMQNKNVVKEYCELFGKYESIGFSTSGEAFLGHMNETSTILILY